MSLRVSSKVSLTISNDNSASPTDLIFQSGDKTTVDSITYAEGAGKTISVAPSISNHQIDLEGVTSCASLMIWTEGTNCAVTFVPTGAILSACSPLKMRVNEPFLVPSDLVGVYVTNADSSNSAKFHVGAAGN